MEGKKFHRLRGARRAFVRNLAADVIRSGKIETTEARAKALRPVVERMVSIAKRENLAARRVLLMRLGNDKKLVKKLFEDIAPRYKERAGGYMRVVKLGKSRKRDGAGVALLEFV